jgi:hypothetical protein
MEIKKRLARLVLVAIACFLLSAPFVFASGDAPETDSTPGQTITTPDDNGTEEVDEEEEDGPAMPHY